MQSKNPMVGEGIISSMAFRTGTWLPAGVVTIDAPSAQAITPRIDYVPGGAPDDPGVHLICDPSRDVSEIVIFPITSRQRNGIESLRLVAFVDDEGHATGTAICQELLRTVDFRTFDLSGLHGGTTNNKGMALSPGSWAAATLCSAARTTKTCRSSGRTTSTTRAFPA